MQTVYKKSVNC